MNDNGSETFGATGSLTKCPLNIAIVYESWRPHPLAWIHRAEARAIAEDLRRAGHEVRVVRYRDDAISELPPESLLLRLSDPIMLAGVRALTRADKPYLGPSAAVMERCYDKYEAYRIATANGVDCPLTALGNDAANRLFPLMLKPRRGSDSIGVRLITNGVLPARSRTEDYIVQSTCAARS